MSDFGGTILFVSHDRYLLNKVPDKIVEITENGADIYSGNYDDYCEALERKAKIQAELDAKKAAELAQNTKKATSDGGFRSKEQRRLDAQRKNRIKELERLIEESEARLAVLEEEMTSEEVFSDYKLMAEKCSEADIFRQNLDEYFEEWTNLE